MFKPLNVLLFCYVYCSGRMLKESYWFITPKTNGILC